MGRLIMVSRMFVACGITFIIFCMWQVASPNSHLKNENVVFDPNTEIQLPSVTKPDNSVPPAAPPAAPAPPAPPAAPPAPPAPPAAPAAPPAPPAAPAAPPPAPSAANPASSEAPAVTSTPPAASREFPKKVWHKSGPKGISQDAEKWVQSWTDKNPSYRHEVLNDATADTYVREHYSDQPDIIDTYFALTVPILRADLIRYLILYAEGGIWSDLDAECLVPVDKWIPEEFKDKEINMVVGMEFDWGWHEDLIIRDQFNSWSMMAKPGSRHLKFVIKESLARIHKEAAEHKVELKDYKMNMVSDVVLVTGPKIMTDSILLSLGEMLGGPLNDRNISTSKLKKPTLLGDVLIMPGAAMAALQNGMPEDEGEYLVSHHYAGSWKNLDGGEAT